MNLDANRHFFTYLVSFEADLDLDRPLCDKEQTCVEVIKRSPN